MVRLSDAYKFARDKHKGQLNDNNEDYFTAHCIKVFHILEQVTDNQDILMAALCHDLIEDAGVRIPELIDMIGPHATMLVDMVTHRGKKDQVGYYFPNLQPVKWKEYSKAFHDAALIKFADRLANLSDMESWTDKRKAHYLRRSVFWKLEGRK